MNYDELIRDACNVALTPSTRLMCAWHAVYWCCVRTYVDAGFPLFPADTQDEYVQGVVERARSALNLPPKDASVVRNLCSWALYVAPRGPLPMSPSEAVALAERVHKTQEKDAC
jgi:hypothetical protein